MALNTDDDRPLRAGKQYAFPVKGGALCFAGAIAVMQNGWLRPGYTALGLKAIGIFERRADNSAGADGAIRGHVRVGCFAIHNSAGGDEITFEQVGLPCYIVDDCTVSRTDGGGTRSEAGIVRYVENNNAVWVDFTPRPVVYA
jgi:hypothetical protein